jgi:hypothetical protein
MGPRTASAQFSLSSENRSITASASFSPMMNDGTSGSGVYNNSVEADGMADMTGDSESSTGIGAENTDIETTGFSGNGSATSNASLGGSIQDSFSASAESDFDVTFTVPVARAISLTGQLTTSGGDGTVSASFDAFSASASPSTPSVPISFSETLQPGHSYTLHFMANSVSALTIDGQGFESLSDSGEGDYSFDLSATNVPEPAGIVLFPTVFAILRRSRRRKGARRA